jgi:hypothetical protein
VAADIGFVVTATGRGAARIIGVIRIPRARRRAVLIGRTTTPICVPITAVIELARRCPASVVVPARAITTGRTTAIIVLIIWCGRIGTTSTWGAGAVPITAAIIWPGAVRDAWLERWRGGRIADFRDALDFLPLELAAVQLGNGVL